MSDDWRETTLGEIATWGAGGTPKAGDPRYYENGTIPWAVIADVQDGPVTVTEKSITPHGAKVIGHLAPADSVLVTMYGTIGRVGLTTQQMATNQAIAWGVADPSKASPSFLFHWMRNHQPVLDSLARGATQRNINRGILKAQPVLLPPLRVQRRIVDLLEHLDTHLANLQSELAALTGLVHSLALAPWAQGVSLFPLGTLGTVTTGSTPKTSVADFWNSPDVPFVTPGDLAGLTPIRQSTRYVSEAGAANGRLIPRNSVAVVCIGATIGKVGITANEVVTNQQINAVGGLDEEDGLFLALVLHGAEGQRSLLAQAGQTAVPILNKSKFSSVKVPWPERAERVRVAQALKAVLAARESIDSEQIALAAFRSQVLAALLIREVEIPDSYDELLVLEAAS